MPEPTEYEAPITEHLAELRNRLIKSLIALFVGSVLVFIKVDIFFDIFQTPLHKVFPELKLVALTPTESFFTALKISLLMGFVVSSPFIFFQVWKFIEPALYENEKKLLIPFVFFTTLFFISGAAFAFFLVLPLAIKFLLTFGYTQLDVEAMLSVSSYISFVIRLILAFGITFELPVILSLLARLGLVSPEGLIKIRPYFIVGAFAFAAFITPPDIISQILLALPLVVFYEISIFMAKMLYPKSEKARRENQI
ncbi:twin-arginine translocase subunit TatC [Hydrogenothermus marinus]|uniref:Sec-independent protein translocase protein TatC n=1 Tax=Hydrogenothermus marinus TaxID=133270 RepID=A0A3M0B6X6_9AQUI|nr:twin-arginine translocase subunit TatC [Hydrogenothermus marinus]RMA93160.1 sec-independent protein translocase protein TatC [Hydrogenothermus marinus]